jgi:DNA-binding FadR family transcriptional regulator
LRGYCVVLAGGRYAGHPSGLSLRSDHCMPRLHQEVMRPLVGKIVSGELATGDRLPREQDLAAEYRVSRGVARECIRGLEERGLLSVKHGIGATVTGPERWDVFDPMVLAALMQSRDSSEVLAEYIECRRILEVEAAGLAAERATPAHLEALSAAFAAMSEAAHRALLNSAAEALYRECDIAFHRAIVVATENRALARMTEPLHRALVATLQRSARPQTRLEHGLPEHERILNAILGRDADAARQAMRDHLATVENTLDRPRNRSRTGTKRPTKGAAPARAS